jgi:murein tripeptide amidase MpaA
LQNSADHLYISSAFEGGSIGVEDVGSCRDIRLRLLPDADDIDTHWFFFRLAGARDRDCRLTLVNSNRMARLAGRGQVPDCWTGYRPFASNDGRHWFRTSAEYSDGIFSIRHRPERDMVFFAYYPPYSMARHQALIARCLADKRAALDVLGQSPNGWDIEMLRIGTPGAGKPKCWIMGRQHPSETMASFFMEGFLRRLLDPADALARTLLAEAEFHVIPMVNPDGSATGRTRTNARGMNLNRAWADPDPEKAPEVMLIRDRMLAEGVDFCLDVHGDEELPYVFLAGPVNVPSRSERIVGLFADYQRAQHRANPDYRPEDPYPGGIPAEADLRMAWNWIGEQFGCLSILLEQPFKDTGHALDEEHGWSPARCARLGATTLDALAAVLPDIRR